MYVWSPDRRERVYGCLPMFFLWVGSGVYKWTGWVSLWCVGMGGLLGAEMVSSTVMYNFGVGPGGDPLFQEF